MHFITALVAAAPVLAGFSQLVAGAGDRFDRVHVPYVHPNLDVDHRPHVLYQGYTLWESYNAVVGVSALSVNLTGAHIRTPWAYIVPACHKTANSAITDLPPPTSPFTNGTGPHEPRATLSREYSTSTSREVHLGVKDSSIYVTV